MSQKWREKSSAAFFSFDKSIHLIFRCDLIIILTPIHVSHLLCKNSLNERLLGDGDQINGNKILHKFVYQHTKNIITRSLWKKLLMVKSVICFKHKVHTESQLFWFNMDCGIVVQSIYMYIKWIANKLKQPGSFPSLTTTPLSLWWPKQQGLLFIHSQIAYLPRGNWSKSSTCSLSFQRSASANFFSAFLSFTFKKAFSCRIFTPSSISAAPRIFKIDVDMITQIKQNMLLYKSVMGKKDKFSLTLFVNLFGLSIHWGCNPFEFQSCGLWPQQRWRVSMLLLSIRRQDCLLHNLLCVQCNRFHFHILPGALEDMSFGMDTTEV